MLFVSRRSSRYLPIVVLHAARDDVAPRTRPTHRRCPLCIPMRRRAEPLESDQSPSRALRLRSRQAPKSNNTKRIALRRLIAPAAGQEHREEKEWKTDWGNLQAGRRRGKKATTGPGRQTHQESNRRFG